MTHLGAAIDTLTGIVRSTPDKVQEISHVCTFSAGHWLRPSLAPPASFGLDGVLPHHGPLVSVSAQTDFISPNKELRRRSDRLSKQILLNAPEVTEALRVWLNRVNLSQGGPSVSCYPRPDLGTPPTWVGECVGGWVGGGGGGGVLGELKCSGLWSQSESLLHVNLLEARAVFRALQTFEQSLCRGVLLVQTDNTTVPSYLNQIGGTSSRSLDQLIQEITRWCLDRGITLLAVQNLSGADNVDTDLLSRQWSDLSIRE